MKGVTKNNNSGQTKLKQKIQALDYHNYQLSLNPKHKQSDTIEFFRQLDEFPISKSSFNRWILDEKKLRSEFTQISRQNQDSERRRSSKNGEPTSAKLKQFINKNNHIVKCMEYYFLQRYFISPEDRIKQSDLVHAFNKFKKIYHEETGTLNQEIDDASWVRSFYNWISGKIYNISRNFEELKRIESASSSLAGEKSRIFQELQLYSYDNIYYFNEIILDLDNLYELSDFKNKIFIGEESFRNNEQDLLTGDIRKHNTVTLSISGNLNGTDFLPPLFVSNILNENNDYLNDKNNLNESGSSFYYHPEGLNAYDILQNYFHGLNTKLLSKKKRIKIIFDNYWAHLGLKFSFSNIEFVLINSKYDRTISSFSSSTLILPYDTGLERLLRFKLKSKLFKFFYKNRDEKATTSQFMEKYGGIIHNILRCYYDIIIQQLIKDPVYKKFYELNILSSKFFNVSADLYDDSVETRSKFKIEKGVKLATFVHSKIGKEFSNILKYNDKLNLLYIKDKEDELNNFIKEISASILNSNNINDELNMNALCKNILQDFTYGRNEVKGNKQYSDEGISKLVKKIIKFENRNKNKNVMGKGTRDIDNILLETIQPFLIKNLQSESSSNKENKIKQNQPEINTKTLELFTKFYDSYVNDTTILHPINAIRSTEQKEVNKNYLQTQEKSQQEKQVQGLQVDKIVDPIITTISANNSKEIIDSSNLTQESLESPTMARHKKRLILTQSPMNKPKIMKLFSMNDDVKQQIPNNTPNKPQNFKSTFSDDSGDESDI